MKKNLLYLAFLSILLSSCAKDIIFPEGAGPGNGTVPGGSGTLSLGGTSWKLTGYTVNVDYGGGLVIDMDLFAAYPACNLDDIHTFNANGTVTDDAGMIKCSPTDPQTVQGGTWKLSSDKKTLDFSTTIPNVVGLTSLQGEVLEFTEKKFVMRYITYFNGPKAINIATYARFK